MTPAPPTAVLEDAARLAFRAMVLVYVVHEGGRWSPYDAHYLPGPETPVTRLSEPANYRVSDDDPPDRTVLCAEMPCAVGDPIWSASEDELATIVDDALARHRSAAGAAVPASSYAGCRTSTRSTSPATRSTSHRSTAGSGSSPA